MTQPGCGLAFPSSPRVDRRNSLRKSFTLNPRLRRHTADRPPASTVRGPDMTLSHHAHTRSTSDKMRNMQLRKKKERDIMAGMQQAGLVATDRPKKNAKHMDLMEAASQTDSDSLYRRQTPKLENKAFADVGTGKENYSPASKPVQPKPFNGDASYRQIAYNQYLAQAFGLDQSGRPRPQPNPVDRLRRPEMPISRPDSEASAMTCDSMEVNFHMATQDLPTPSVLSAKDRRPKIQLQIPGKQPSVKRPTSTAHLVTQISRQKTKGKGKHLSTQISPPSATGPQHGEAPARLSIVSPLSVVEMPKPRRPFSAWSLEDMTNEDSAIHTEMPNSAPLMEKQNSSESSDDTFGRDSRSSTYTRRSSLSSLTSDTMAIPKLNISRRHSIAFSIADPNLAGVFDAAPPMPKHQKSSASLALNTNKPLPPAPAMEEVRPLRLPSQSYSCGTALHPKRRAPSPLNISRSSTTIEPPKRMSSLRSKYTPADLDALDAAFVKSSPQVANFGHWREPSWEQAQNALEEHLDTIAEDDSPRSGVSFANDPLQISRGPNDMVPSRQAPAPPPSINLKLSDGSVSSRKRLQKQPSKHVAMQMRSDNMSDGSSSDLRKRISAPVGGSLIKANRILGKSGTEEASQAPASVQMEREISSESNWSSSESPDHSYNGDSSSPNMSHRGDTSTPETDISSIPDHAFEEVKARLELLSPKNNLPSILTTWDHVEPNSPFKLPLQEHSRPTTSDSDNPPEQTCKPLATTEVEGTPAKENGDAHAEILITFEDGTDMTAIRPRERQMSGQESLRPRSLASIAMSEIPELYASMPASYDELTAEEAERMISADAAEKVLLRILENLDNLQDLFATATVSRGFYRTFKRYELPLMKNALYGMSPAAWELREMTCPYPGLEGGEGNMSPRLDYNPTLYLQHYMRDMYTMIALKSMILIHCESFLRADTITALAGGETERASQIDDAFWRVWTFCQIFGSGSNREDDIVGQLDWLRGGPLARKQKANVDPETKSVVFAPTVSFGHGNAGGLSAEDLYDMTEIWTCLGVLVRGFQGKRQEARDFGVFENAKELTAGDVEAEDSMLEEWTYHLLTLAPPVVLDVTSPTTPTAATFAHARSRGYTSWTPPPVSRATFLKEALSRVYQEKIGEIHPSSAPASPKAVVTDPTSPLQPDQAAANETMAARWRVARHAAEIRAKRNDPNFKALPPSEDRPMSNYPDVLAKLDATDAPPVPAIAFGHSKSRSDSDTSKHMVSALVVPRGPQVRDPVDVAVERLVYMGFEPAKAKRALACTDTGNSVDFEGALEALVRERKRDVDGLMHLGYRGRLGEDRAAATPSPIEQRGVGLGLGL